MKAQLEFGTSFSDTPFMSRQNEDTQLCDFVSQ
jgi:hypothetical protein